MCLITESLNMFQKSFLMPFSINHNSVWNTYVHDRQQALNKSIWILESNNLRYVLFVIHWKRLTQAMNCQSPHNQNIVTKVTVGTIFPFYVILEKYFLIYMGREALQFKQGCLCVLSLSIIFLSLSYYVFISYVGVLIYEIMCSFRQD